LGFGESVKIQSKPNHRAYENISAGFTARGPKLKQRDVSSGVPLKASAFIELGKVMKYTVGFLGC